MGALSIWHILLVAVVVLLLFGRGKMSDFMGDFAKGIKMFKKGLSDDEPQDKARVVHEAEVVNVHKDEKVPH
jgi:sec-independent protein translocase protein TatA